MMMALLAKSVDVRVHTPPLLIQTYWWRSPSCDINGNVNGGGVDDDDGDGDTLALLVC